MGTGFTLLVSLLLAIVLLQAFLDPTYLARAVRTRRGLRPPGPFDTTSGWSG